MAFSLSVQSPGAPTPKLDGRPPAGVSRDSIRFTTKNEKGGKGKYTGPASLFEELGAKPPLIDPHNAIGPTNKIW